MVLSPWFAIVVDGAVLSCVIGGKFDHDASKKTVKVKVDDAGGTPLVFALQNGNKFSTGSSPCTKPFPTPFPKICSNFAPAITLEIGKVSMDGESPLTEMSISMCIDNGIPAFLYDTITTKVKVI
jgi:hypothetical protein